MEPVIKASTIGKLPNTSFSLSITPILVKPIKGFMNFFFAILITFEYGSTLNIRLC